MVIKVLGPGCQNCANLKKNVEKAVRELGINATVVKVTDYRDIMAYGVMSTPALVINERVVSMGRVLSPAEIAQIIQGMR